MPAGVFSDPIERRRKLRAAWVRRKAAGEVRTDRGKIRVVYRTPYFVGEKCQACRKQSDKFLKKARTPLCSMPCETQYWIDVVLG